MQEVDGSIPSGSTIISTFNVLHLWSYSRSQRGKLGSFTGSSRVFRLFRPRLRWLRGPTYALGLPRATSGAVGTQDLSQKHRQSHGRWVLALPVFGQQGFQLPEEIRADHQVEKLFFLSVVLLSRYQLTIERADQRMYHAKQSGKDRTVSVDLPADPSLSGSRQEISHAVRMAESQC